MARSPRPESARTSVSGTSAKPEAPRARRVETALARVTLVLLLIYLPGETYASWAAGLWHPMFLVDLIAILLLFLGARRSLRARPDSDPALLAFAYAWATSNGWRATSWRALAVHDGQALDFGVAELWIVAGATLLGLVGCGLCLWLICRRDEAMGRR